MHVESQLAGAVLQSNTDGFAGAYPNVGERTRKGESHFVA